MWKKLAVFSLLLSGCASHIETVNIDPETLKIMGPGVKGVLYYEPSLVKLTYVFTQRIEKEKGVVGSRDEGTCQPIVQKEEIVTLPNFNRPRAILHKPALFAASDFSANFNNGMLASVNTKSTPQGPAFLEQINKAKEVGIFSFGESKACNASPVIDSHKIVDL